MPVILLSFVFDLIVDYTYQSLAFNYNSPIPSCIVHGLDVTPCQIYIYWPLGIVSSLTFLGFTVYSVVQKKHRFWWLIIAPTVLLFTYYRVVLIALGVSLIFEA